MGYFKFFTYLALINVTVGFISKAATVDPIIQTKALMKAIGRRSEFQSLAEVFKNEELVKVMASYAAPIAVSEDLPKYESSLRGIENEHNLCYIIAPAQLIWALQRSLYQRKQIPSYCGQEGDTLSSVLTTTLKEHEKQDKTEAASPANIMVPVRDWVYRYAREVYDDPEPKLTSFGRSDTILELYLKNLNELCRDSEMPAPCPIMQRTTEGAYIGPMIGFIPKFIAEEQLSDCEESMVEAVRALPGYPPLLRMKPAKDQLHPGTKSLCFPVDIITEKAHYLLRGALIQHKLRRHTVALIRQGTSPDNSWFECDDHQVVQFDDQVTQGIAEDNAIIIEDDFPSDIMYELQK